MGVDTWAEVDRYFTERLGPADPALAVVVSTAAGG